MTRIEKGEPATVAERYLSDVCRRSFLSLWSYPAVYRDQGRSGDGDGKEVADHLVVFEDDVVIFSDKDIAFGPLDQLTTSWGRWHRRAVLDGARQLWGAERWVKEFPKNLFLDRKCTTPFPFPLPSRDRASYHLLLVAHGASKACKEFHGGSGSLMLFPTLKACGGWPFAVGDLDPNRTFVHVLDDTTLDIVMKHCDTVSDFIAYLRKKAAFIRSKRLLAAAGEEELLAVYLKEMNEQQEHDFILPKEVNRLVLPEGHYTEFIANEQYKRKVLADEPSYAWDSIIEAFAMNVLGGTLYEPVTGDVAYHERGLRLLARENRVRRRMLARALIDMMHAPKGNPQRRVRVSVPSSPADPFYVFLSLIQFESKTYEEYRKLRRFLLLEYCRVVRLLNEGAHTVVGLGVDFPGKGEGSEDLVVYDGTQFTDEERAEVTRVRAELNLLNEIRALHGVESEYPAVPAQAKKFENVGRNEKCPCGSGLKFKKCHGS